MFLLETFDTTPQGGKVDKECIGLFTTKGKVLAYLVDVLNIEVNLKGYKYSIKDLKVID